MLMGLVLFGASLTLFAFSQWFWLSLLALIFVGGSQQSYNALNNTLLQEHVDEEYRGRVLSTLLLDRGMAPLGTMIAGFGTEIFGPQATIGAMAAILIVMALIVARFAPTVRGFR